ncbi:methyltransferase domain-containing protein [Sphingobacterium sp. SRCM116780]|uniref:methyltransferase domain-containing protein n=1 Tax=Sphingobacterium sp. SRCM116780 TaxID=2907623 RepID=UPI001F18D2BA|nr:methyltransferase domain-containing protein [Sphingobacterium sp. SRCM116780]UIR54593.1 methyltransferase domain-containing protein [Sphingobacterium sp. SRCM116780]
MNWNPEIYNQFKTVRYQPFYDLIQLISTEIGQNCIDIGCGTGEQTYILANTFNDSYFLGIDPSDAMLSKSADLKNERLIFKSATTEDIIATQQTWDLIFSNAALQWSDNHEKIFPELLKLLNEKGQFAVQMPMQHDNMLNQLLLTLVQEEPFKTYLDRWVRESPVLSIDQYAQILYNGGLENLQIIQKVYPIIANNTQELVDFISGSALIPYLDRLEENQQEEFISEYKKRIDQQFPKFPALYAFKRLLLYGRKIEVLNS